MQNKLEKDWFSSMLANPQEVHNKMHYLKAIMSGSDNKFGLGNAVREFDLLAGNLDSHHLFIRSGDLNKLEYSINPNFDWTWYNSRVLVKDVTRRLVMEREKVKKFTCIADMLTDMGFDARVVNQVNSVIENHSAHKVMSVCAIKANKCTNKAPYKTNDEVSIADLKKVLKSLGYQKIIVTAVHKNGTTVRKEL